uniref:Uncharacterized protein n=1 Tax=viral metagenome TaxID=1070528 RepID=A0A6C0E0T5_9ZZZZ
MTSIQDKLGYIPSKKTDGLYATLMETSGEENESWLYFIRVEGNEENLQHLQKQLEKVDWYILDDLSTFDLELEHPVSAQTAKEMSKLDLNHTSFHRKFDGILKKIDLDFNKKDGNETKICKTFDILGYGQIEDFIDDEDLDEEDLVSEDDTENESVDSESGSENEGVEEKKVDLKKILKEKKLLNKKE